MALSDNLIAAWELDEASGNAIDSHGSNDLTDTNSVGSDTGLVYGSARDFESGSNQYFTRASNSDLQVGGGQSFTFETWLKFESLPGFAHIASKWGPAYTEWVAYLQSNSIRTTFGSGGTVIHSNGGSGFSTGVWYHVVWWLDGGTGDAGIAINAGTPVTDTGKSVTNSAAAFYLGSSFDGSPFDGLIGPMRFWKRVLTSDERTELYNAGAGRDYAYIVGGAPPASNRRRRLICGAAA